MHRAVRALGKSALLHRFWFADVRIPWKAFVRDGTLCQLTIINPLHDRAVPDEEFVWFSEFVCFADGISVVFIEHEELFWGASRPHQ